MLSLNLDKEGEGAGLFFDLSSSEAAGTRAPPGFQGELKPYQEKALSWMLSREGADIDVGIDMTHVPYWWDAHTDLGLGHPLMVNTDLSFVAWKRRVEKRCRGGILADEMGLGKTIMVIALLLAHRPQRNEKTLIVAPLTLVRQWREQLQKFAPELRVHVTHESRLTEPKLAACDVVITTEGKIRSEGRGK